MPAPNTHTSAIAGLLIGLLALSCQAQTSTDCQSPSLQKAVVVPLKNPSFDGDSEGHLLDWRAAEHVQGGQYLFKADTQNPYSGNSSALIRRTGEQIFGFLYQEIKVPECWRNKIAHLSGFLRTEDAADSGGGLVIQAVNGSGNVRAFDHMNDRLARNTTPWKPYEVSITIPPDALTLRAGAMLQGGGSLWVNDLKLEIRE